MDARVRSAIELMRVNQEMGLSARGVAAAVNLSETHLRRLFRQETGMSLMRYSRQLRMERAKQLLETTHLSVKEIAARGGINNVSHFVRDFAKVYGHPPGEHRRRATGGAATRPAAHDVHQNGRIG